MSMNKIILSQLESGFDEDIHGIKGCFFQKNNPRERKTVYNYEGKFPHITLLFPHL